MLICTSLIWASWYQAKCCWDGNTLFFILQHRRYQIVMWNDHEKNAGLVGDATFFSFKTKFRNSSKVLSWKAHVLNEGNKEQYVYCAKQIRRPTQCLKSLKTASARRGSVKPSNIFSKSSWLLSWARFCIWCLCLTYRCRFSKAFRDSLSGSLNSHIPIFENRLLQQA